MLYPVIAVSRLEITRGPSSWNSGEERNRYPEMGAHLGHRTLKAAAAQETLRGASGASMLDIITAEGLMGDCYSANVY